MPIKGIVSSEFNPDSNDDELQFETSLRPSRLDDFAGQTKVKENLKIAIEAARRRGLQVEHHDTGRGKCCRNAAIVCSAAATASGHGNTSAET